MRKVTSVTIFLALLCAVGCGGGSNGNSSGSQGISGSYEFVAVSNVHAGTKTLIEANLSANGAGTSASGPNQVQTATYVNGLWYVNGGCSSSSPGQNSITGTVSGSNISLTFNEGGNVFTGQGTALLRCGKK